LVEILHNLSNMSEALPFVRGSFKAVNGIWWLKEDRVVDNDLSIGPAGRQTVSKVSLDLPS
jgi:hypothetical protein